MIRDADEPVVWLVELVTNGYQGTSLRDGDDELAYVISLFKLEIVCLAALGHQTHILPLVKVPSHLWILFTVL